MNNNTHSQPLFAAIQMVSGANVEKNMERARVLVGDAARQGAQVVLLPENFAVFNSQALCEWGEKELKGALSQQVAQWAKEFNLWIVAGTLPQRNRGLGSDERVPGKRVRTRSIVFNPNGKAVAWYDKIHLFDVDVNDAQGAYRESETIEPGDTPKHHSISLPNNESICLGLSVCYDLRFPELYRVLRSRGANVFTVPAAFTWETGRTHWEPLLRARAIENQCYVMAANQGGQHSATRKTWGHSMIIDPWGEILASADEGEAVVCAPLDLQKLNRLRTQMPVQAHRVINP